MSEKGSAVAADERALIGPPVGADGAALWRLARVSGRLDLNSSYSYLLWCRDFADTTVVARVSGEVVGFVSGFLRPTAPDTVLVWQVAVDPSQRGKGLAGAMLDHLADRLADREVRWMETTVTPDNEASIAMFASFARRRSATMETTDLFRVGDFPDDHEAEQLYRIGPL